MNELDPPQTALDTHAIAEFCQYEHVTITQVDAQRVKASFQDIFGEGSVTGTCVVSVLLAVARRQKVYEYLRGSRAGEQQIMEALHALPVLLTINQRGEQAYTRQVLTRNGTAYTLPEAISRGLEAMIEQLSTRPS